VKYVFQDGAVFSAAVLDMSEAQNPNLSWEDHGKKGGIYIYIFVYETPYKWRFEFQMGKSWHNIVDSVSHEWNLS